MPLQGWMTMTCRFREDALRYVGDPVDVITGALIDATYDFRLEVPFPFEFVRHYNSNNCEENRGLGWGHRHDFDHELQFTYDNTVGYVGPDGTRISFRFPQEDGARTTHAGYQLERVRLNAYNVHLPDERILEFEMWRADCPARLVAMANSAGKTHIYYDGTTALISSFSDSLGRTIRVDWVQVPDPFRPGVTRAQMAAFVLLHTSQPSGPSEEVLLWYKYDPNGHLVGGADRYRGSFAFEYDATGRMSKLVDRRGYAFHYAYDNRGRCIYSGAEDQVEEVRLQYLDGATVVFLADGGQWLYEHHDGYLARMVDPYGGEYRRELDDAGKLAAETDASGRRFEIVRDATGKAIGRADSAGHIWPLDSWPGPPAHYVAATAREWEYGSLLSGNHGLPIRRHLELDLLPAFIIDALTPPATGKFSVDFAERWQETTVHDPQGLRLRVERSNGERRSWSYDASANRTRFTDFDGSSWRWTYESWNRIKQIINPLGAIVDVTHSRRLMPLRVIDPSGFTTEYRYDLRNRLSGVFRDGVVHETYSYDAADELAEKRDRHGRILLRFEREDDGRRVTIAFGDGGRHELVYTAGRQIASASATQAGTSDTYAFEYSIWGQRVRDERNSRGVLRGFDGGELTEIRVLDRFITRYERKHRNRIDITDPTGATHSIQTCQGGVVRRRMSNGVTEVTQFHPGGDCLAKFVYTSAPHTWTRLFERSGEGDVRAIHDSARGTHRYSYDAAHRLIGETLPSGETRTFRYSLSDTLIEAPGLKGATVGRQRLSDANGSRFEYDHRDNLSVRHTSAGTFRLTHNARDQLVSIEGPAFRWSARYDVLGRRIETDFNGTITTFYWDVDRLAAEVESTGRVRVYVYADDLAMAPVAFIDYEHIDADPRSGRRYFVFGNHLGAPEIVHDDAGNVVWRARYEAYGAAHVEIGQNFHQPLRWPGHYFDIPTGLHYVRFRYYSPELGHFLETDPQGLRGGFNLYGYGSANPVRHVDVRGLSNACPETSKPQDQTEGGPDKQSEHLPRPLDEHEKALSERLKKMSDGELRDYVKERSKALRDAYDKAHPKKGEQSDDPLQEKRICFSVGVTEDAHGNRRVIVTSSSNHQQVPNSVKDAMHPGERVREAPPRLVEEGRGPNPNHRKGGPKSRLTNPESKQKLGEYDKNGNREGDYSKKLPNDPKGETRHHAEQRMENGADENNETVLTQQPTLPCCKGTGSCTEALGNAGKLDKIPEPVNKL
ncbi:DUF6531 domain-containing protein [Pendulispora brunnea]|uniref:DUF6531 domain-containing protein n=1 Tax=Pendulispora brunnea TaxID=2905690 RepID=A0ABZ2KKI6_9BACT